ncbi:hypothetical protein acdb102_15460 [Acidothermaceae bacterium B102]|nr:hypothetical protein acdb102_15460 [Acidothermaceae bacterium B102]
MFRKSSVRVKVIAAGIAFSAVASGVGVAAAATKANRGVDTFGMTQAFYKGKTLSFTYTKGFYCDTSVTSKAATKCEVGVAGKHAPSKVHDPLYITVPLGFSPKLGPECPAALVCVDHPATADLTRLEPALKGLYPTLTDAQLTSALKNFGLPAHDHFVTYAAPGFKEWWDVIVIGVTSPSVYAAIQKHKSYSYIAGLLAAKNASVVGPIPSNVWLYFSVN